MILSLLAVLKTTEWRENAAETRNFKVSSKSPESDVPALMASAHFR